MKRMLTRRRFLVGTTATGFLLATGERGLLVPGRRALAVTPASETGRVRLDPDMEPLVRFLEETPRKRLLEEVGLRIGQGLDYGELLAALLLAGVRNIQPRPVGFKFHAVMVVNAVHLAAAGLPEGEHWLPLFWALDYFKQAQAQDVREGDWSMGPVDAAALPPASKAPQAFITAMERWDEAAADVAAAALARSADPPALFEILCRYGVRDYRDIGHKAIYMANGWRTWRLMGFQNPEPVLRSLAYAFLAYDGPNPTGRDQLADRPWRDNRQSMARVRGGWQRGELASGATNELLEVFRRGSYQEAADSVVVLLNRGVDPRSIWDGIFCAAVELLMNRPGIVSLHAVTASNAIHYAFRTCTRHETRLLLLLQNAAFIPLFRGAPRGAGAARIDELQPAALAAAGDASVNDILADILAAVSRDRPDAAGKVLGYLESGGSPDALIASLRRLLVYKGLGPHDYKFTCAVLEDYYHVSPRWRNRFLAASVFNLRGSGSRTNPLMERARQALGGRASSADGL